jgi:hypothetical protein
MFRDMSGQAETAAALQKSVELAASGSEHAAEQAGRAMESLMQHQQAMARIAADVATNATSAAGAKSMLAGQSVSKIGAVLNSAGRADAAFAKKAQTMPSPKRGSGAGRSQQQPASPNPAKEMPFETAAYSSVIGELEGVLKARGKWQQDADQDNGTDEARS